MKKYLVILVIAVLGVGIGALIYTKMSNSTLLKTTPSPASPGTANNAQLNYLTATIDKIEGNNITVTQKLPDKTRTYKVTVNKDTKIKGSYMAKPPALQQNSPAEPPDASLGDLQVGQYITVATSSDITNSNVTNITAVTVQIPPLINAVNGKVISADKDKLIIEAYPIINPVYYDPAKQGLPEKKEFTINYSQDLQVFKTTYSPADGKTNFEKITISDLKKDMQVTVFTDYDLTSKTDITAKYIDILPEIINAPAVATNETQTSESTPSPTIKKSPAKTSEPSPQP